jgi:hypothetical protein
MSYLFSWSLQMSTEFKLDRRSRVSSLMTKAGPAGSWHLQSRDNIQGVSFKDDKMETLNSTKLSRFSCCHSLRHIKISYAVCSRKGPPKCIIGVPYDRSQPHAAALLVNRSIPVHFKSSWWGQQPLGRTRNRCIHWIW